MEVHRAVQGADEECFVGTRGLVGSVDGFCLPVCPVDVIFKQGQCKDVWDVLAQHCGRGTQGKDTAAVGHKYRPGSAPT